MIDPNAKFLDDEEVEGARLLTDAEQVNEIRTHFGKDIQGPHEIFAAMWHVDLSMKRLQQLRKQKNRYFVAPKPVGRRFMLYVNAKGEVFMENNARNVFQLVNGHEIQFLTRDGSACTDTILDGVVTRATNDNSDANGYMSKQKLTFVIMDAARCNGRDLTKMSVVDRLNCVKVGKMRRRMR